MVDEVSARFRHLWIMPAVLCLPFTGFAHQLDEYLQATLVSMEPGSIRLQINLTPGVAVAEKVLALIDRDHNGVISTNEATAYAESLRRDLVLKLDERKVEAKLESTYFPEPAELRTGWGIILMEFSARPGALASGFHKFTLENRHLSGMSVYLFNAERPKSNLIQISKQTRNNTQSVGEIEFNYNPPINPARSLQLPASALTAFVLLFAGVWLAAKNSRRSLREPV